MRACPSQQSVRAAERIWADEVSCFAIRVDRTVKHAGVVAYVAQLQPATCALAVVDGVETTSCFKGALKAVAAIYKCETRCTGCAGDCPLSP